LINRKGYDFSPSEVAMLRATISQFTVRRTKTQLNKLVDKTPDRYRNSQGDVSRYPHHISSIYSVNATNKDVRICRKISELASQLKAVTYFQKSLELPINYQYDEKAYLASRLKSSSALSKYMIMSALRSSRAALHQHIDGTDKAVSEYQLEGEDIGNRKESVFELLDKIAGSPPKNSLGISIPDWLEDSHKHKQACEEDKDIYKKISWLASHMSDTREIEKAKHVIKVLDNHKLVLAFDHRPISLAVIGRLIKGMSNYEVLISSGTNIKGKKEIIEKFQLGSSCSGIVGLTSDALAESVNLQQASAVINLDLPSVIRMVEQRVGRVDRMNSPHKAIDVYWPSDISEFALSSDQKLVERHEAVGALLGSNMPLPEGLTKEKDIVTTQELIEEFENKPDVGEWDGITDAFISVRELIEGDRSLIEKEIYEKYRHITARVLSRVSLVKSKSPWAFFCLTAGAHSTPRWVFLSSKNKKAILELDEITQSLRENLTPDIESIKNFDSDSARQLDEFLNKLKHLDRELLPRKQQRALHEMEIAVSHFQKKVSADQDQDTLEFYTSLLDLLRSKNINSQPDWEYFSTTWLDLVRPIWHEFLPHTKKKIPMLKDIRSRVIKSEENLRAPIFQAFDNLIPQPGLDERIKACIVGIKSN